jgi:hypothetical protein
VPNTSPAEPSVKSSSTEAHVDERWWTSPLLKTFAPLVIAVIALGVAIAAWVWPSHQGPSYPQSGDARTNLCGAYKVVHHAVVANTHLRVKGDNDPAAHLAVAANARVALIGGGGYLRDVLAAQTDPPADLAKAVDSLAGTVEQLGVNYLADAGNDAQAPLRKDLDSEMASLNKLCQ